jgi:predicted RNase H-like HicB family nuclease
MVVTDRFTGVFVKVDDCYIAYAEEEPAAMTQGRTIEEARSNLVDAYIELKIARAKRSVRKIRAEQKAIKFETELTKTHKETTRIPLNATIPA